MTEASRESERWTQRAKALAQEAIGWMDDSPDQAIAHLSAAIAALKVGLDELPAEELVPWFPEDDDESDCTCTPEQRATGGFKGSCPVHGSSGRARG